MDLEQLRRINTLSSELKRHGMADSSTDAYEQAEQIIQIVQKPKLQLMRLWTNNFRLRSIACKKHMIPSLKCCVLQ